MATAAPTADGPSTADTLWLADWRRRIATLYAEVRELAATDRDAALDLWRSTRERLYREHPQSPVPPATRASFRASYFAADPGHRFEVAVEPDTPSAPAVGLGAGPLAMGLDLPVSAGGTMSFGRLGWVSVPFEAGPRRLAVYWMAGYAGGLFLPFRDATNGRETYAAGRYLLDAAKSADLGGDPERGTLILDFDFSFHPSCAFDPRWACPLAPPDNRLDIEIRAGERLA